MRFACQFFSAVEEFYGCMRTGDYLGQPSLVATRLWTYKSDVIRGNGFEGSETVTPLPPQEELCFHGERAIRRWTRMIFGGVLPTVVFLPQIPGLGSPGR